MISYANHDFALIGISLSTAVSQGNEIENSEKYIFFMSNYIYRLPKLCIGLIYNKLKMKQCNSDSFGAKHENVLGQNGVEFQEKSFETPNGVETLKVRTPCALYLFLNMKIENVVISLIICQKAQV